MRVTYQWCLALSAWLACSAACASALDTLNNCAYMDAPPARELVTLQAACPELEAALTELGFAGTLPDGWRETLTRDNLRDLVVLATRYKEPHASDALDVAALPSILKDIASEQPVQAKSWWQTFREWLRSWFDKKPEQGDQSWLERWLSTLRPPAVMMRALIYILLGAVVLAAVHVVINELRAAGLLQRRTKPAATTGNTSTPLAAHTINSVPDFNSGSLRDQPAILLRLLVTKLLESGRLSAERFLTHRELAARVALGNVDEGNSFTHVAHMAERLLYGADHATDEQVNHVVTEGRELLQQLDMPRGKSA